MDVAMRMVHVSADKELVNEQIRIIYQLSAGKVQRAEVLVLDASESQPICGQDVGASASTTIPNVAATNHTALPKYMSRPMIIEKQRPFSNWPLALVTLLCLGFLSISHLLCFDLKLPRKMHE